MTDDAPPEGGHRREVWLLIDPQPRAGHKQTVGVFATELTARRVRAASDFTLHLHCVVLDALPEPR